MSDSRTQRSDVPVPTEPPVSTKPPASSSGIVRSAPTSRPLWSGSLEGLLASIDAQLPGRLRRLAAPGRGRGVRIGVFPSHVLIEWRAVGVQPEHYTLPWHFDGDGVVLGDELTPVDELSEQATWQDVLSSFMPPALRCGLPTTPSDAAEGLTRLGRPSVEAVAGSGDPTTTEVEAATGSGDPATTEDPATTSCLPATASSPIALRNGVLSQSERRLRPTSLSQPQTPFPRTDDRTTPQIEQLAEQLRQVAAERDRLAERLAARSPRSVLRRSTPRDLVADEQFVRVIKRR